MTKVDLYNINGEKEGDITLPKEIFDVKINSDLIYQVVKTEMSNRRQGSAHSKDRGDVSGGGKKPWRQKGTGRARHGSNRSPIWVGGGVTFGPRKERNYKKKINKKARRKALLMVLSGKKDSKMVFPVSDFKINTIKTKIVDTFIKKVSLQGSTLILLPEMDKKAILSTRNIENIDTIQAKDINPLILLSYKNIVIPKESLKIIKDTFVK